MRTMGFRRMEKTLILNGDMKEPKGRFAFVSVFDRVSDYAGDNSLILAAILMSRCVTPPESCETSDNVTLL